MSRYSIFTLARNAFSYHQDWREAWRSPNPHAEYDVVIIGAGLHGLSAAYYLATKHGITNVAVVDKGWLGGGNAARNTTIVRSNYLEDASAGIYQKALQLWQDLSQELNFNVMFSPRGVYNLGHTLQDMRNIHRRVNANRLNGIEGHVVTPEEIKQAVPILNTSPHIRYPILGASYQAGGGIARHDAVAWGYARGADAAGVDIIQGCQVVRILKDGNRVIGIDTTKGTIKAKKVGIVVAGHSSVLASMAGFRLPVESHPLQALVSEPLRPMLDTVVMSNHIHVYVSQSDKGELVIGAGLDHPVGYSQRGGLNIIEDQLAALKELIPVVSRVRMLRQWGGIVDTTPDASPILGKTPVENLFINTGWGTGGFKATPAAGWTFAHTLATGEPHEINAPFSLDRFVTGNLVDEHGAAAVAH